MSIRSPIRSLLLIAALGSIISSPATAGYAMYVWSTGFDASVPGCDEAKLVAWDSDGDDECYTHNWASPESRQWLWDTANRPGREIDRLFISDIKDRLKPAFLADDCSDPDVLLVKQMLKDGHCKVPGVKIHALFATSDEAVSEQNHIPYVVWYNDTCAGSVSARFDGVAVNNEKWGDIKCTSASAEQDYLDNLQAAADAAALQVNGTLATHYSIGWHWGQCSGVDAPIEWNGTVQPATYHMIDIFDSVDVQVAIVSAVPAANRAVTAGYAHAVGTGKPFYVLSYTNQAGPADCTTTHFPYYCSYEWSNPRRTDDYMMENIFDQYAVNGLPLARPAIHYFRGVYSTGVHADWPSYYSGTVSTCTPVAVAGPVTFANPDDDDEITWPYQDNATVYELARADTPVLDTGCRVVAHTSQNVAVDPLRPAPGSAFYYLVRVLEPEPGEWGESSDGTRRMFSCPQGP